MSSPWTHKEEKEDLHLLALGLKGVVVAMFHIRQSRPEYGLGFQGKVLTTFQVVPSSLGHALGEGFRV